MRAEIITVGSELLLGQIVDSNAAFIARQLAEIGLDLHFKTTVGDNLGRLVETLRHGLSRSEVIITSGGLGPTPDDITREAVAHATGSPLGFSPRLMAEVEAFFRARGLTASASNRKQAYIPQGAVPIPNPIGTAPGFIVHAEERMVVALPGVPRELEYLLKAEVIPYLKDRYGLSGVILSRVLKLCGLGESRVGEMLGDFMERGANPTVGTMAHLGQVDVRITAKGATADEASGLILPAEQEIRGRLGEFIFGVDDETLEGVVLARLRSRGWRLASVEVGLGGLSQRLQNVPDAAVTYLGGVVVPSEASRLPAPLSPHGSAAVLAEGVMRWLEADVGAAMVLRVVPLSGGIVTARVGVVTPEGSKEKEFQFAGSGLHERLVAFALNSIRLWL